MKTLITFVFLCKKFNSFHKPELPSSNSALKTWLQTKKLIGTRRAIKKTKGQKQLEAKETNYRNVTFIVKKNKKLSAKNGKI
jgi:hypothetical protein